LAKRLAAYKGAAPVVLALPRGGMPVAAEVAAALGGELDLMIVRKIGVPFEPELAMGAVADGPEPVTVRNEDIIALAGIGPAEFDRARDRELAEIARRRALYLADRPRAGVAGRTVIVVDDGVATGATVRAALKAVRALGPKMLVLAVPVGATETIQALRAKADEVVCLEQHEAFGAIGLYYADFRQVSDETVKATLARFPVKAAG